MKNWKLYLLNAFLLVLVGYSILPDFSLNKNSFNKVSGILSYSRMEVGEEYRPKRRLFNNISSERIIIRIADSQFHEYYITDIYKDHWETLLSPNAIGKGIVLYLGKENKNEDPFRIELNGELVYDTDVRYFRNILIILFTLALTLRNLFYFFKSDEKIDKTTSLLKTEASFIQIVKKKFINIRDYFLE